MSPRLRPVLAAFGLALAACSSTRSSNEPGPEPAAREQAFAEHLALRDPRTGEERGQRFLELVLSNTGDERVDCRCAPEWFDVKGATVSAAAAWQRIDLRPGAEVRLRFAPMPASARSWRLRFDG